MKLSGRLEKIIEEMKKKASIEKLSDAERSLREVLKSVSTLRDMENSKRDAHDL